MPLKINIYQINRDRDTQQLKFMGLDAVRKVPPTIRSTPVM